MKDVTREINRDLRTPRWVTQRKVKAESLSTIYAVANHAALVREGKATLIASARCPSRIESLPAKFVRPAPTSNWRTPAQRNEDAWLRLLPTLKLK